MFVWRRRNGAVAVMQKGLWIIGALISVTTGLWGGQASLTRPSVSLVSSQRHTRPGIVRPNTPSPWRFPSSVAESNPSAASIGSVILESVIRGHSISGVLEGHSKTQLVIRELGSRQGIETFRLSARTVWWRGGWRFSPGHMALNQPVSVVVKDDMVVGVVGFHDAYGRIVGRRGKWVAIRPVDSASGNNPACAIHEGPSVVAEIVPQTVWNSRKGLLAKGSLVQYTVYGQAGHPLILGGVEDYGQAPCAPTASSPSPSLPIFSS